MAVGVGGRRSVAAAALAELRPPKPKLGQPNVAMHGKKFSRCSLPLAGREEPQIDMEMPFNSNAVPSNVMPSRSRLGRARN